jgi:hypothetical protein
MFTPLTPLHIDDSSRRGCALDASVDASGIIKAASDTIRSRVAGIFHRGLVSEAQDISTASKFSYGDPESTLNSQPIILGFSLPPYYFSYTASTRLVVDVFCQLVSFVEDNQAWDMYVTPPTPVDYSVRDSWPFSSFPAYVCIQSPSVNSRDPGLGTNSTETTSVHWVRRRAQISSR